MFDFWQQSKLRYLRKHNQLNLVSMRRLGLPHEMIRQVFLDQASETFFDKN